MVLNETGLLFKHNMASMLR